jgi:pathogenesis-related protein 1
VDSAERTDRVGAHRSVLYMQNMGFREAPSRRVGLVRELGELLPCAAGLIALALSAALSGCSADDTSGTGRTTGAANTAIPAGAAAPQAARAGAGAATSGAAGGTATATGAMSAGGRAAPNAPVLMPAAGRGGTVGPTSPPSATPGPAGSGGAGAVAPAAGRGGSGQAGALAAGSGGAAAVAANGETGRLIGITAAHNAVRAMVQTDKALPPLTWSPAIAEYAQEWADMLAMTSCNAPMHRSSQQLQQKGYGENLAVAGSSQAPNTTSQWAVDGWADEVKCWTYGSINGLGVTGTEKCDSTCYMSMHSDGCGHYTQIVWRNSTQLGCGVATCKSGQLTNDIWICNYAPPGNVVGQKPY